MVIYHPSGQILTPFLEELDGLLSSFMEDGTPLLVFGDFNIHLEKPYATDFHSLLASFDLKCLTTTSTHKSGNQFDLIYTCDCTADNILVQQLHISDHFFIKFTLHFATRVPPTPLPVTFRRNLRSLSPSHLSSVAAARLVFNEPKRAHVTPLFVSLHWLPVAARIQFKTLMLAYRTTTGSAPTYFHSLLRIYIPSRSLRSASERRLMVPSQRGSKSLSRTFSFTVLGWWNLPPQSGKLDPCQISSNN